MLRPGVSTLQHFIVGDIQVNCDGDSKECEGTYLKASFLQSCFKPLCSSQYVALVLCKEKPRLVILGVVTWTTHGVSMTVQHCHRLAWQ